MPRPVAVLAVIVPVILIGALIALKVVASLAESFIQLAESLPDLAANPPSLLYDIQTWLAQQGITIDLVGAVQSLAADLLTGMADLMVGVFTGALSAFGTFIDAIIVISLAVFMAIDKEAILRVGLDAVPPSKREDALPVPAERRLGVRRLHPQPVDARRHLWRVGVHRESHLRAAVRARRGVPRRSDHGDPDLRPGMRRGCRRCSWPSCSCPRSRSSSRSSC